MPSQVLYSQYKLSAAIVIVIFVTGGALAGQPGRPAAMRGVIRAAEDLPSL
jgi:hypothetical protein